MKKQQPILIGLSVAIDGTSYPGSQRGNILGFAAVGGKFTFQANLLPIREIEKRVWWEKNPPHFTTITTSPRPVPEVMEEFDLWLRSFHGVHPVICGNNFGYWWLYSYMREFYGKCVMEECFIDVRSFNFGRTGQGNWYKQPPSLGTIEDAQNTLKLVEGHVNLSELKRPIQNKGKSDTKVLRFKKLIPSPTPPNYQTIPSQPSFSISTPTLRPGLGEQTTFLRTNQISRRIDREIENAEEPNF